MVEVIEVDILPDGTSRETKKMYSSKKSFLRLMRKSSAPTTAIYQLSKCGMTKFMQGDIKVDIQIKDID